ncbi:response regulator [Leptolyngbya iicbica]|uniref:Response regulator n=2 Tax=Cyanophyceae TaxID=3028117 RepID=A0A4Q7EAF9_9CYAN|nr:response regulator [Leptolyngbya sp. LK]RZM79598.1 response regulator [Leptolyngbya sp. LK]
MSAITSSTLTILSIDDSIVMQQLIKQTLSEEYRVLLCDSAIQALALINQEPISLVLLDVSMPEMDGLDFCRTVRSIPKFQHLPIVMVTGRDSNLDKLQGRLAGATEYLTKPFDTEQLKEILRRLTATLA